MFSPLIQIFAEAEEKSGAAVLGIDVKVLLLQAGTFLILFFIIKKFALTGIVSTLEKRRLTIDKGVELGLEMQKAKADFDDQLKQLHVKARNEADQIIMNAQKESADIIKAAEVSATKKAEGVMKDASARIDREVKSAREGLRHEMLALVAEATEVIIDEKLDTKKDASLISRALTRLKA